MYTCTIIHGFIWQPAILLLLSHLGRNKSPRSEEAQALNARRRAQDQAPLCMRVTKIARASVDRRDPFSARCPPCRSRRLRDVAASPSGKSRGGGDLSQAALGALEHGDQLLEAVGDVVEPHRVHSHHLDGAMEAHAQAVRRGQSRADQG